MRKGISRVLSVAVASSIGIGTVLASTGIAAAQDTAYD